MKIKTIIASEQPLVNEQLLGFVQHHPDIDVMGVFDDFDKGKTFILSQPWDLLLLYIPFPSADCKGSEINHLIVRNTILIADTPEFALANYELGGLDYIVGPVTSERLNIGIEKFKYYLFGLNKNSPVEKLKTMFCEIKDGKVNRRLSLADILYVQGFGPYLKIFLVDNSFIISYMTFKQLHEKLNCDLFVQSHRSYVVNTVYIKSYTSHHCNLINDIEIPMSKQFSLLKV